MTEEPDIIAQWSGEEPYIMKKDPDSAMKIIKGHEAEIYQLKEEKKKLREALSDLLELCNRGNFSNGNTDPSGITDEGEYWAFQDIEKARAALKGDE